MALLLENTVLYHAGRTGGHWVRAFVCQAGLVRGESPRLHDSPEDLRYWPDANSRAWSIAFVRHPLTWIRSLWIHETHFGWTHDTLRPLDEYGTFAEYLEYLIDAFPGGAVTKYFAPFIDNVKLIGKFEKLAAELVRLLKEAGESVPETPFEGRAINSSADDIVSGAANAPRATLERFLANESSYCTRFGYENIPVSCVAENQGSSKSWFPVLPSPNGVAPGNSRISPENTFVFSDGTQWRGRPECRRWQLAFVDALVRSCRTAKGGFLELGCGDGFFVFLAEKLGYAPCRGVNAYRRSTTVAAAARLESGAEFVQGPMIFSPDEELTSTILIRDGLNTTSWPHLLLAHAKKMLAPEGQIIIGSVIIEADFDPGLCVSNFGETAVFPQPCPLIMSKRYLLNMLAQCGLAVDEIYSEYDELVSKQQQKLLEPLTEVFRHPPEGLLRRVVWRLRAVHDQADSLEQVWRPEPRRLEDWAPINLDQFATRTIDQLTAENAQLKGNIERLELALHDREGDLAKERHEAALRNAELVDRTGRLERALAELVQLRGRPRSGLLKPL